MTVWTEKELICDLSPIQHKHLNACEIEAFYRRVKGVFDNFRVTYKHAKTSCSTHGMILAVGQF